MKSRALRGWLIRGIGLGLLVLILARIDIAHSLGLLRRVQPLVLAGAVALIFPMMALKTARWMWLQRSAGLPGTSFGHSYLAYFTGMYAGLITPGRVGEFVRVKYLTDRGAGLPEALATVLWDRIIDVAGLFLLGLLALWPLAGEFRGLYAGVVVLAVVAALPFLLSVGGSRGFAGGLRRRLGDLLDRGGRVGRSARRIGSSVLFSATRFTLPGLAAMSGFTLAGWVVYYLQALLLARTLGIPLPILPLVVTVTAAAVAAFLPVSISGLGTRDAAMVVLFQRFGRPSEEAVALSTLVFLVLVANALLGLAASHLLDSRRDAGGRDAGPGGSDPHDPG